MINDAISHCNDKTVYGKAGDEVKIIAEFGNVVIVEGLKGERFPVKKTGLAEEVKEQILEAAPDTAVTNTTIINRAPVSKKKAMPINQPTLF